MFNALNISEASNLAIHALIVLNNLGGKKKLSTQYIAKLLKVSESHLAKVMQRLVKKGILQSVRGAKGGFNLKKKPEDITLLEVTEIIDGNVPTKRCLFQIPRCQDGDCIIARLQHDVSVMVRERLAQHSIADFMVDFKYMSEMENS
ncbi:Rrf2 family transcriptional regulator [Myxococcota bacterium]|nr:Rrf2 family transcriptional regulator [Myxococcota bacterium]MBU1382117.1 Rrf2 family transcriptional regulator [Myxococcota bacterium]MBU1498119.1 Rrf2 family transcriptional regulator [Myxococcota bacterium]